MESARESSDVYLRRAPSTGVFFEILATHLKTLLVRFQDDTSRAHLPSHIVRELEVHIQGGILAYGCTRFRCYPCGTKDLLAFSCKGRGFCPSRGGGRMAESAASSASNKF